LTFFNLPPAKSRIVVVVYVVAVIDALPHEMYNIYVMISHLLASIHHANIGPCEIIKGGSLLHQQSDGDIPIDGLGRAWGSRHI
jgi:hypothetical protein